MMHRVIQAIENIKDIRLIVKISLYGAAMGMSVATMDILNDPTPMVICLVGLFLAMVIRDRGL